MGLLSPSLVLNVFELEWTFDELIFPCLVGLSDDRLDGVHNSNGDDDGGGGSKLFSKIEWLCVCACEMESVHAKTRNISQLMD